VDLGWYISSLDHVSEIGFAHLGEICCKSGVEDIQILHWVQGMLGQGLDTNCVLGWSSGVELEHVQLALRRMMVLREIRVLRSVLLLRKMMVRCGGLVQHYEHQDVWLHHHRVIQGLNGGRRREGGLGLRMTDVLET